MFLLLATASAGAHLLLADPQDLQPRIYGGDRAQGWSSVVAVHGQRRLCSGTLLTPKLVLTAAHCLTEMTDARPPSIYTGEVVGEGERLEVAAWGEHPEFCPSCASDLHDYGYVLLEQPLSLPEDHPEVLTEQADWDHAMGPGGEIVLVGFGENEAGELGRKRAVNTAIDGVTASGEEFQVGGGGAGACKGDSGGPAYVTGMDGHLKLTGVLSRGHLPCDGTSVYGVTYRALCWLAAETQEDVAPADCPDCSCLQTAPEQSSCALGRHDSAWWAVLALLALRRPQRRNRTWK